MFDPILKESLDPFPSPSRPLFPVRPDIHVMILMITRASYASCTLARRAIHILVSCPHKNYHIMSREPVLSSCYTYMNPSRTSPSYVRVCYIPILNKFKICVPGVHLPNMSHILTFVLARGCGTFSLSNKLTFQNSSLLVTSCILTYIKFYLSVLIESRIVRVIYHKSTRV